MNKVIAATSCPMDGDLLTAGLFRKYETNRKSKTAVQESLI